jgi:hypothetical protein
MSDGSAKGSSAPRVTWTSGIRPPLFYGWVLVAVAFVTMAVGVNARTAFSLLFPAILDEFGWDRGMTAGAFSFGFLVSALVTPCIGWLMDLRSRFFVSSPTNFLKTRENGFQAGTADATPATGPAINVAKVINAIRGPTRAAVPIPFGKFSLTASQLSAPSSLSSDHTFPAAARAKFPMTNSLSAMRLLRRTELFAAALMAASF